MFVDWGGGEVGAVGVVVGGVQSREPGPRSLKYFHTSVAFVFLLLFFLFFLSTFGPKEKSQREGEGDSRGRRAVSLTSV